MLATTTANATTDYAEVTAKATIEVANTIECTDLDWGTIVVKQNNQPFTLDSLHPDTPQTDVISYDNNKGSMTCTASSDAQGTLPSYPANLTLTANNGGEPIALRLSPDTVEFDGFFAIESALDFPANVKAGDYEAKFTLTLTY